MIYNCPFCKSGNTTEIQDFPVGSRVYQGSDALLKETQYSEYVCHDCGQVTKVDNFIKNK